MNSRLVARIRENDPCVTELSYAAQGWGQHEVERLARVLTNNTVVKSLILTKNEIGPQGSASIARILRTNKNITYVDLSENHIGNIGAKGIFAALRENQALEVLKLNENGIGNEGLENLTEIFSANCCALTNLELMSNGFNSDWLVALSGAVNGMPRLSSLDLSWNTIDEEGMKCLADVVAGNRTLTSLKLSMCDLTTKEMRVLAAGLKRNTTLDNLDLSGNNINWEGAKFLSDSLMSNPKLQNLTLKSNNLGDEGVKAIAALFDSRSTFSVNLRFNEMGVSGAKALAEAIRRNPSCTRPVLRYLFTIKRCLSNETIKMNQLKLFSYLTGSYVDFDKPTIQKILLGAVYGAGIQQLQQELFYNEQTHLIPLAMWRVGSKLKLDGFYEIVRCKPELLRDSSNLTPFRQMIVRDQLHPPCYEQNIDGRKRQMLVKDQVGSNVRSAT